MKSKNWSVKIDDSNLALIVGSAPSRPSLLMTKSQASELIDLIRDTLDEAEQEASVVEKVTVYLESSMPNRHYVGCECGFCNGLGDSYRTMLLNTHTHYVEGIGHGTSEETSFLDAVRIADEEGWIIQIKQELTDRE